MAAQIDAQKLLVPISITNEGYGYVFAPDAGVSANSLDGVLTWSSIIPTPAGVPQPAPGQLYAGNTYIVNIGAAQTSSFSFTVDASGNMTFDKMWNGIASGSGTTELIIDGFAVTIDARPLSGLGFLMSNTVVATGTWFRLVTGGLIPLSPGAGYLVQQGSGEVADLLFNVDMNGHFTYATGLDVSHRTPPAQPPLSALSLGGPLRGAGTSTLELLGVPVLLDGRKAGITSLLLPDNSIASSGNGEAVLFAILLPYQRYSLELNGVVQAAAFAIGQGGLITLFPVDGYTMVLGEFHGLALITIGLGS